MSSVRKEKGQHKSSSSSSNGGNSGGNGGSGSRINPIPTTTSSSSTSNEIDEWRSKAKSYKHKLRTLIELLRRERDDNEATFADIENKLETATRSEQIAVKRTHEQTLLLDQLRARLDDATTQAAILRKENADLRHSLRLQQQPHFVSSSSSLSSSGSAGSTIAAAAAGGSHRSRRAKRSSSNAIHSAADKDSSADDETSTVASLKARILELEANCEKAHADLEAAQRSAVVKLQAAAQVVVRLENRLQEQNQLLAVAAPAVPAPLPPTNKLIAKERPNSDELSRSDSSGRRHQTVHGSPTTPHRDKLKSSAPNQLSAGSAVASSSSPSVKKSSRNSGALDSQPPAVRAPEAPSPRVTDSPRVQKSPARGAALAAPEIPPPPPSSAPSDASIPPPADTADIIDLQSMMAQLAARSAMASAAASAEMDMLNATIARSDTMLRASEDIRAVVRGKLERKPTYSRNKALDELVKEASADIGGD